MSTSIVHTARVCCADPRVITVASGRLRQTRNTVSCHTVRHRLVAVAPLNAFLDDSTRSTVPTTYLSPNCSERGSARMAVTALQRARIRVATIGDNSGRCALNTLCGDAVKKWSVRTLTTRQTLHDITGTIAVVLAHRRARGNKTAIAVLLYACLCRARVVIITIQVGHATHACSGITFTEPTAWAMLIGGALHDGASTIAHTAANNGAPRDEIIDTG